MRFASKYRWLPSWNTKRFVTDTSLAREIDRNIRVEIDLPRVTDPERELDR